MVLVAIDGAEIWAGAEPLLKDVNIKIQAGAKIGLIGRNGTGKSTLFRTLVGEHDLECGDFHRSRSVNIAVLRQDLQEPPKTTPFEWVLGQAEARTSLLQERERLQQSMDQAVDTHQMETLSAALAQWAERYAMNEQAFGPHKARAVLHGLGFDEDLMDAPLDTLSGGWRMRAQLAGLLFAQPDILLLDEPTNHLDFPSVRWLIKFLQGYNQSFVLISHDAFLLDQTTQMTWAIQHQGLQQYDVSFSHYLKLQDQERSTLKAAQKKQQKAIAQEQAFIDRFRSKATKAKAVQSRVKRLEKMEKIDVVEESASMQISFETPARISDRLLSFEGLRKKYDATPVFKNLEGYVDRTERIAIVGANGTGKSTLLKILAGTLQPTEGQLQCAHGLQVGYFAQEHIDVLNADLTAQQAVMEGLANVMPQRVRDVLGALGLRAKAAEREVRYLSGGERARVSLARLLVQPLHLLLLDEPTNHLDLWSVDALAAALQVFPGAVVFVSHHQGFLQRLAEQVWCVKPDGLQRFMDGFDAYIAASDGDGVHQSSAGKDPIDLTPSSQSRQQKRREAAQLRQSMGAALKPLKSQRDRLLVQIDDLESQLAQVEGQMQSAEFFASEAAVEVTRKHQALQLELEQAMQAWEAVEVQIEDATRSFET